MRVGWIRAFAGLVMLVTAGAARPEEIGEALDRSQRQRLDAMPVAAEGEKARLIRESFSRLLAVADVPRAVELRIVTGPILAETLAGGVIVANERLADLTEAQRRFVLAHELGHVALGHWGELRALYRRWVPGEVRQEQTDAIATPLGQEASALSHRQEYEADAQGLALLRAVGGSLPDAVGAFMAMGAYPGSATHPGSRQRVAALRLADAEAGRAQVVATRNDPAER